MTHGVWNSTPSISSKLTTFKKSLLASSIALALSACSGGSSSSLNESNSAGDSGSESVQSSSFSGTVADGYLQDARVCLDLNDNKVCDENEPSTISTAGGEFTIEGVTQEQLDLHAIVVEVIAGLTVDEDDPGVPIDKAYTMTAPAGYDFVSPLTTMVQQEIEENKDVEDFDITQAENAVKTKLGTSLDLREDYVEAKGNDSDYTEEEKAEFEKLHKVAQVTARVFKENIDDVKQVVDENEVSFDQVLDMVVSRVLDALEEINEQVDDAIEQDSFDPDTLSESETVTGVVGVDTTIVADEIAARQAEKEASAANLVELVTSVGINWFEGYQHDAELELYYGTFQHDTLTGESNESGYSYDASLSSFIQEQDEQGDNDYLLTPEGWVNVPEKESIVINDDGTITISNAEVPSYSESLEAKEFNIAGLNIKATMAQSGHGFTWSKVVDAQAVFGAEARGFKLTFTTLGDQYRLWNWDCEESEIVGGMCNSVWSNTGEPGSQGGPATTLGSLLSETASEATSPEQIRGPQVAWYPDGSSVFAEMLSDGTVNFYHTSWSLNGGTASLIAEGTWTDRTVGDITVRTMELPTNILGEGGVDFDDRNILFTELDGYVRRGEFIPAGEIDHGEVVFNIAARDDIVNAFRGDLFNAYAAELALRHEERMQGDESQDPSNQYPDSSDSTQPEVGYPGDGTQPDENGGSTDAGSEQPQEPQQQPLQTTLNPCEFGDSEFSNSDSTAFATRSQFDGAVAECGGSIALTEELLLNKSFTFAHMPDETVEFLSGGVATMTMSSETGEVMTEQFSWAIVDGNLVVSIEGVDGSVEQETLTVVAEAMGELSVKGFSQRIEGSAESNQGEIWSDILVELN